MLRRTAAIVSLVLLTTTGVALGAQPDANELLSGVARQLQGGVSLRYKLIAHTGEDLRSAPFVLRASVLATIDDHPGFSSYRADLRVTSEDAPRPVRWVLTRQGEDIQLLDYASRAEHRESADAEAPDPRVALARTAADLLAVFRDPSALGGSAELDHPQRVGADECDVLRLSPDNGGELGVAVSQRTGLPVRITTTIDGVGPVTVLIKDLRTNVRVPPSTFALKDPPRGFTPAPAAASTGNGSTAADRAVGFEVGDLAPGWTLSDPSGKKHALSDYRGQVVVMDFWATWCGPCKRAMPGLQKLHKELGSKGVNVIGINAMEKSPDMAPGYMRSHGYTYQLLLDGDAVAQTYKVRGIPTFYVIGKQGEILFKGTGYSAAQEQKIQDTVRSYLGLPARTVDIDDIEPDDLDDYDY